MKTWITYLASVLMGFATCLIFGDSTIATGIFSSITTFLVNLGIFLFIPLTVITFASGIASLRKDKLGAKTTIVAVVWAAASTLVLSIIAAIAFYFMPVKFPVSSSAGSDAAIFSTIFNSATSYALNGLYPSNPFLTLAATSYYILPLLIISWILGVSLKPSADIIRPAYTVMNSFSEVMYRIVRTVSAYGFILVYAGSSYLFLALYQEKTILVSPEFVKLFLAASLVAILVVIPLLYAIFTGFKRNPYWVLGRSFSSIATGLFTGNILASSLISEGVSRHNLGVQKRIASTATPLFILIGRGGTALVSTLSVLALLKAVGAEMSLSSTILIALALSLTSLLSSIASGYELLIVIYSALKLTNISLYGAEATIIALLPLLSGIAIALDVAICHFGNALAAYATRTDVKIPYRDIL